MKQFANILISSFSSPCAGPIAGLWRASCNDGINDSLESGLHRLSFKTGFEDARWGLLKSDLQSILVRSEYQRFMESVNANCLLAYIMLRGSKGIGKTVLMYWLIAHLGKIEVGTILLLCGKNRRLLLHRDEERAPCVTKYNGEDYTGPEPDYVLSDVCQDPSIEASKFHLLVASHGGNESECAAFRALQENHPSMSMEFVMTVWDRKEIAAQMGDGKLSMFFYDIFGGSARLAASFKVSVSRAAVLPNAPFSTGASDVDDFETVVKEELDLFCERSEYAAPAWQSARDSACEIISAALSNIGFFNNRQRSLSCVHSIFLRTIVGTDRVCTEYASSFMRSLAGKMLGSEVHSTLVALRPILLSLGLGLGLVSDREIKHPLWEKLLSNAAIEMTKLNSLDDHRAPTDPDREMIAIAVQKKVFIRKEDDIALLCEGDYGVVAPGIFPLVDWAVKTSSSLILGRISVAQHRYSHRDVYCGPDLTAAITRALDGAIGSKPFMLFCCDKDTFNGINHEASLSGMEQYKMQIDGSEPSRKRSNSVLESESTNAIKRG